jgi:transcriptional regulator with XRE-family HTH domain
VVDAGRLKEKMREAGLSQSELARRVGISQASVQKLTSGAAYGSKHLHRIARELGTTPAYLSGETDDPQGEAPELQLSAEEQRLLEIFREMPKKNRAALKLLLERMTAESSDD